MADLKFQLDSALIEEELDHLGWNKKRLAAEAGISKRTLDHVFTGRPVTLAVVRQISRTLARSVLALTEKHLRSGPDWLDIPVLGPDLEDSLMKAAHADMRGEYRSATAHCQKALEVAPESDLEVRAFIQIKLAAILDNGGDHARALQELDSVLSATPERKIPKRVIFWARYHRALCLRRLNRLPDARNELEELARCAQRGNAASVQHQLGVVLLHLSKTKESARARVLLRKASQHFIRSREYWGKAGNHREGFSMRRLAEVAIQAGQLRKAVRLYAGAIAIFGRHECARYVDECTQALICCVHGAAQRGEAPIQHGQRRPSVPAQK